MDPFLQLGDIVVDRWYELKYAVDRQGTFDSLFKLKVWLEVVSDSRSINLIIRLSSVIEIFVTGLSQ